MLIDKFLSNAIELDIDAVSDGKDVLIGGIMQHIEQAGVHSGDSACSLPVYNLPNAITDEIRKITKNMALELGVIGVINMQIAYQNEQLYIIEVNPRASRTLPFISKAIGVSLAKIAAKTLVGRSLQQQNMLTEIVPKYFCVKAPVFPFNKFPATDPIVGPEMKSTGEVMGVGESFAEAYEKALLGASQKIPTSGIVFLSVKDSDKKQIVKLAAQFAELNFEIRATEGTYQCIKNAGISCSISNKVTSGIRPSIVDEMINGEIQLIINTSGNRQSVNDSKNIRTCALAKDVYYTTTMPAAFAVVTAIKRMLKQNNLQVRTLQEFTL